MVKTANTTEPAYIQVVLTLLCNRLLIIFYFSFYLQDVYNWVPVQFQGFYHGWCSRAVVQRILHWKSKWITTGPPASSYLYSLFVNSALRIQAHNCRKHTTHFGPDHTEATPVCLCIAHGRTPALSLTITLWCSSQPMKANLNPSLILLHSHAFRQQLHAPSIKPF